MYRSPNFSVRSVAADRISDCDVGPWAALEARALEPSAYLSPHFVRPAGRHLALQRMPQVYFVERRATGASELVGVAVMLPAAPCLRFPARRLVGQWTHYSPVGGALLDRDYAAEAPMALLAHVRRCIGYFGAVEFPEVWRDGALVAMSHRLARESGGEPSLSRPMPHAILLPSIAASQL